MRKMFMKRTIVFACWFGLATVPVFSFQATPSAPQEPKVIKVQKLKDNFYVLSGGGGNTSVFITQNNGVVVVDTKLPGWGPLLVEKIKSITDKPITTIINTHCHADHTSGNPDFPSGIQIVAQENTKLNMEKMDLFKQPGNDKFLPTKTFKDKLKLFSGADEVDIYYFGVGGTNGDAWVVFPSLRIAAAGDEFAAKTVTYLDETNGGTGDLAHTLLKAVKGTKNADTVIPGHSETMMTRADLIEWADFNQDLVDWALAEKKAGKSVDVAITEYKIPAKYTAYAPPSPRFIKATTQVIYDTPDLK
jgi:cyclase